MDEYLAVIKLFGFQFAPRGWAYCDGSLLNVNTNTALFSLIGASFGGSGVQSFGLPDLRGRTAVGQGAAPGLQPYTIGQKAGAETVTLTLNQLPAHTHTFAQNVSASAGTTGVPTNAVPAQAATGSGPNASAIKLYAASGSGVTLAPQTTSSAGGNQAFSILQPYLVLNYSICISGIFPSRN